MMGILAAGAAIAYPPESSPASPPPASAADAQSQWHSMPQDGLFSSIKQNLRESAQEVVRGHFDLGEPPNVRRYYCLVSPKSGRREPNGVLGDPLPRPDGMTGIKFDAVSLYTCAMAEQKGYLVSTGYLLVGPALARRHACRRRCRASRRSVAAQRGAATPGSGAAAAGAHGGRQDRRGRSQARDVAGCGACGAQVQEFA
jgi:hypothetical protein